MPPGFLDKASFCSNFVSIDSNTNYLEGKKMTNANQSNANQSNTFSILAIVLGAVAFLILPILLGPAAIILGVVALVKKERLAPIGLTIGILGTVLGMVLGAIVGAVMFGGF
jgi:hypothetical protein